MEKAIVCIVVALGFLLTIEVAAEFIPAIRGVLPPEPHLLLKFSLAGAIAVVLFLPWWAMQDATPLGVKPAPPAGGWRVVRD